MNPVSETWEAIKARLGGPFGTFVLVWLTAHPKVLAYALFDSVEKGSAVSSADAKIQKIGLVLGGETPWVIFWRPVLWTIIVLLLLQAIALIWHYVGEWFRYLRERITAQKNFRIYLYRRMGTKGDEVLLEIKKTLGDIANDLRNFHNKEIGIYANSLQDRYTMVLNAMVEAAKGHSRKLDETNTLIRSAADEPFMRVIETMKTTGGEYVSLIAHKVGFGPDSEQRDS